MSEEKLKENVFQIQVSFSNLMKNKIIKLTPLKSL